MNNNYMESSQNIIQVDGKIGLEWLLTTQLSRIRDSEGYQRSKNISELEFLLSPYLSTRQEEFTELIDSYLKRYNAKLEDCYTTILDNANKMLSEVLKSEEEKVSRQSCCFWTDESISRVKTMVVNEVMVPRDSWSKFDELPSELIKYKTEISQIRNLWDVRRELYLEKENRLFDVRYKFCMRVIDEMGLLPRELVKDGT